jgi:hypothetical protein
MRDLLWFVILPLLYLYAAIFSKLLPPSGIPLLEAIAAGRERDTFFLFLLFLSLFARSPLRIDYPAGGSHLHVVHLGQLGGVETLSQQLT